MSGGRLGAATGTTARTGTGLKGPDAFSDDVRSRLRRTWAVTVTGAAPRSTSPPADQPAPSTGSADSGADGDLLGAAWPHAFPLGQPSSATIESRWSDVVTQVSDWRAWARNAGVELRWRTRRVHGTDQRLPTHAVVSDLDAAAQLAGRDWPSRVARGRRRAAALREFAHLTRPDLIVTSADEYTDTDFDLLLRAGRWFATHDATGLTPRQVPVEGLHAKWLNTRARLVAQLAGRDPADGLGLLPDHPARLHVTYLDPEHLRTGGRRHDCFSVGDTAAPPYPVDAVVISENKDTAVHFPPVPGGVAVEGYGAGGRTPAAFEWLTTARVLVYWGDMDPDGLEILNGFRAAGVEAGSLLMDVDAYDRWERWGTGVDRHGKALQGRPPRDVPHLSATERALYERLVDPTWDRHRRIEQERIPLSVAHTTVLALASPQP